MRILNLESWNGPKNDNFKSEMLNPKIKILLKNYYLSK